MQIEEAFRDLKSERFGLGFQASLSTDTQRIAILLLIALLALMVAWIIGTSLEITGQQRCYQANTERQRRVLSVIYLGRRALHDRRFIVDNALLKSVAERQQNLMYRAFYGD